MQLWTLLCRLPACSRFKTKRMKLESRLIAALQVAEGTFLSDKDKLLLWLELLWEEANFWSWMKVSDALSEVKRWLMFHPPVDSHFCYRWVWLTVNDDNCSSFSLDHKTDSIIQTTLRHEVGADVTVLTIAHRLQTIMDADKIVSFLSITSSQSEINVP